MRRLLYLLLATSACFSKPPPVEGGVDAPGGTDAPETPGGPYNIAFVTSRKAVPGDLDGIVGADAFCQSTATMSGLPGNYMAWISTSASGALARLEATGARGWVRPDGRPVADRATDLVSGPLWYPLKISDTEQIIEMHPENRIATATTPNGTHDTASCNGFTEQTGSVQGGVSDGSVGTWTSYAADTGCNALHRFYCFGTDHASRLTVTPEPSSRRAFVSSTTTTPSAGMTTYDSICQDDADAAGLVGTFRAAVAASGESMKSRFSDGPTWVRHDGVSVITGNMGKFLAPLVLGPTGQVYDSYIVGGSMSFTVEGDAGSTCTNWSTSSTGTFFMGWSARSVQDQALGGAIRSCGTSKSLRVYCLEI